MFNIVSPLFLAGLIALVLGLLMLYRGAFREGWLWGFGCLVLPPLLLLFIVLRWRRTQFGVYALLAGLLIGSVALYAGADQFVQGWLRQPALRALLAPTGWNGTIRLPFKSYQPAQLPNAAEAAAILAQQKRAAAAPPAKPATPAPARPAPRAVQAEAFQPASLRALPHYIGSQVRVTTLSGGQVTGTLRRLDSLGLTVATDQGSGSVRFHVDWTRLQGVEVYAPRGSVPAPSSPAATGVAAAATAQTPPAVRLAPSASFASAPPTTSASAGQMPISPPAAAAQAPAAAVNAPGSP